MHHIGVELGFLIQRENTFDALRSSETRYRQLAITYEDAQHFAHVGSFSIDTMTGRVQWSDEMYRLFGLQPGSRPIDRAYARSRIVESDREPVRRAVEASLHDGEPLDLRFTIVPEDGGERVLRVRGKLVTLEDGRSRLLGSVLDVTTDEQAMRERLELQRELDDAKRMSSLGRLAATMAHEFNNILAGIGSFAEFLSRRATNDETRDAATHIRAAIKRGKGVTADILRYTRASKPMLSTIDVRAWLESFIPEANALTDGRVVLEGSEPLYILADVGQLNQALANLVINARDASPRDERIVIRVSPGERDGRPAVDLAVIDRGCGIPAEIRERIFEPLFTTKHTGTGLGLPLVDQVVRAHGGTVRVWSENGAGSEFHLVIPAAEPPPERTAASGAMNLLLADDNETFANVVAQVLTSHGLRVRVVYRAGEIMPALLQEMADALILDIGLPDMTGTDAYAAIIDRWPALPVVFVSGRPSALIEQAVRQRHVAFLQKPFEMDDLLAALKRVVAAAICVVSVLAPCA
jgi:signal transduction histidine kinase/ActR/RegA family two-component response regulator